MQRLIGFGLMLLTAGSFNAPAGWLNPDLRLAAPIVISIVVGILFRALWRLALTALLVGLAAGWLFQHFS